MSNVDSDLLPQRVFDDAIEFLDYYIDKRFETGTYNEDAFYRVVIIIASIFERWRAENYIGEDNLYNHDNYQHFISRVFNLIDKYNSQHKRIAIKEYRFINSIKYSGEAYRVLGHSNNCADDPNERVHPIYNGEYASWSKNEYNSYIEQKLIGYKTLLSCNIKAPYYGLDLFSFQNFVKELLDESYNLTNSTEMEVVFITKKEFIYNVKYYKRMNRKYYLKK